MAIAFREKENTPAYGVVLIWTICVSLLFCRHGLFILTMQPHLIDNFI